MASDDCLHKIHPRPSRLHRSCLDRGLACCMPFSTSSSPRAASMSPTRKARRERNHSRPSPTTLARFPGWSGARVGLASFLFSWSALWLGCLVDQCRQPIREPTSGPSINGQLACPSGYRIEMPRRIQVASAAAAASAPFFLSGSPESIGSQNTRRRPGQHARTIASILCVSPGQHKLGVVGYSGARSAAMVRLCCPE
ncbi:uncharacterized protein BJ171DRAFT_497210 [Polychytrium aggregatum]|uniref:uncharacterized protein n=1 Tax=Polychytrium aggregatum TaxID=110093 RepID=UPI0022FF1B47|nr:uncharacterized protein BJ171DRAFT_497210 [Polychytrium aggregatum]KAI9206307.1 hypothetical protein BJ171DRAFT_497210 [Polychytrium aggregatum]